MTGPAVGRPAADSGTGPMPAAVARRDADPPVRLQARGHPGIKATHHKTLEWTAAADLTAGGTCMVGVAVAAETEALCRLRGRVRITLRCGDAGDVVTARMNPFYIRDDPLIVRRHPAPQHRSLCIAADKAAADLDRALVAALQQPDAVLDIEIAADPRRGDDPGPGVVFVVATPIGDRRDFSARAVATLHSVDLIVAEDTRSARDLLGPTRADLLSMHDHNERQRTPGLLRRLAAGDRVALISEAGMPLLSDPGYVLVRQAVAAGCLIAPVPGPDAVTTALGIAGLPTDAFQFIGFLPRKPGERRRRLAALDAAPLSSVFFEAPHRMLDCLDDITAALGDRPLAACRNLTKPGEEVLRGSAADIAAVLRARDAVRGEFTVVVGPGAPAVTADLSPDLTAMAASLVEAGVATRTVAAALARATGASRRDMFNAVLALKGDGPPPS